MGTNKALILFTRDPLGESFHKRILNRPQDNITLYKALISQALQITSRARQFVDFDIFVTSNLSSGAEKQFEIKGIINQRGKTFARRLQNAIEEVVQKGYEQVIVIGNDCPDLSGQEIITSFSKLADHDIVLGPAQDGGVYLIGVHGTRPDYFSDVNWFSKQVYTELKRISQEQRTTVFSLDVLSDLDTRHNLLVWSRTTKSHIARIVNKILTEPVFTCLANDLKPFNRKRHLSCRNWQKAPPLVV